MNVRSTIALAAISAVSVASATCISTTGGDEFTFRAFASGPSDAPGGGQPLRFTNPYDFDVTLDVATIRIGAVYMNRAEASGSHNPTSCILSGIYDAEVTSARMVDALSPEAQPFPALGEAVSGRVQTGEVWLATSTVGIDVVQDTTVYVEVEGTARSSSAATSRVFPFDGKITIGANRKKDVTDPTMPGSNPICKERIVSPIPIDLDLEQGGELHLVVDPRAWFDNVDFSRLKKVSADPLLYRFGDKGETQPDKNLYQGIHAGSGVVNGSGAYTFVWLSGGS
jgi:hypothetical protein